MAWNEEDVLWIIERVIKDFEDDSPDAGYGYEAKRMAKSILNRLNNYGIVDTYEWVDTGDG